MPTHYDDPTLPPEPSKKPQPVDPPTNLMQASEMEQTAHVVKSVPGQPASGGASRFADANEPTIAPAPLSPPRPAVSGDEVTVKPQAISRVSGSTNRRQPTVASETDHTVVRKPSPSVVEHASKQVSVPSSVTSRAMGPSDRTDDKHGLIGRTLGGCHFLKKLGEGGMGAVYLARQLSLDRDVAVKILPARMASNPDLLARFTREALSAGQLNHHNIIQVHDVGSEGGVHYIVMEFVKGKSLGDVIRKDGKLTFEDAVGYVLQAARGLKYAHDNGIIHRDIKPDNLMVNEHGVVKVADMGLVKMKGELREDVPRADSDLLMAARADLTNAEVAMGTPSYMAPEQARDARSVDSRADQYSLGCTLYYLCAGKAPYTGTTAFELITKHMKEPLTPLDVHVKGVPPALTAILNRMLEKDPALRYPDLSDAIKDMEDFLGLESARGGVYTPREQHLEVLEREREAYYKVPALAWRTYSLLAFPILLLVGIATGFVASIPQLVIGSLLVALFTMTTHFGWAALVGRTYFARRLRSALLGTSWGNYAKTVGGLLVAGLLVWALGLTTTVLVSAILGSALAVAYFYGIEKTLKAQRAPHLDAMQEMLKQLRLRGVDENVIQDFVCKFGKEQWEEFFEDLFGYEEKIAARLRTAAQDRVKPRKRFATWREPIVRWFDKIEDQRKSAREKKNLVQVEAQRLAAQGVDPKQAAAQAEMEATKILTEVKLPKANRQIRIQNFRMWGGISPGFVFKMARVGLGAYIVAAWALPAFAGVKVPLPGSIANMFTEMTAIGGLAVFITGFSGRFFLPLMAVGGAMLAIYCNQASMLLVGEIGLATPANLYFLGLGIASGAAIWNLALKSMGGKF